MHTGEIKTHCSVTILKCQCIVEETSGDLTLARHHNFSKNKQVFWQLRTKLSRRCLALHSYIYCSTLIHVQGRFSMPCYSWCVAVKPWTSDPLLKPNFLANAFAGNWRCHVCCNISIDLYFRSGMDLVCLNDICCRFAWFVGVSLFLTPWVQVECYW